MTADIPTGGNPLADLDAMRQADSGTESLLCPVCKEYTAKNKAGLSSHLRNRHSEVEPSGRVDGSRRTTPDPDTGKTSKDRSDKDRPGMGQTTAWIETHVQPNLLRIAAMTGIPKPLLAEIIVENDVPIWEPMRPTAIGREIQLDETAVQVYAAAYVYGQDTWLAEIIETWGKKILPLALVGAVAVVTLGHVAKVAALRNALIEMATAQAHAQQAAAERAAAEAAGRAAA